MFQNYFLTCFWWQKYFFPISIYIFNQMTKRVFFWRNHFSVFFNKVIGTIYAVSETDKTTPLSIIEKNCNKHHASKRIDSYFVRKRRTGPGAMEIHVTVLCETYYLSVGWNDPSDQGSFVGTTKRNPKKIHWLVFVIRCDS